MLLVTSNGTGMGHLTRQSAIARALGDRADVVVLSLSSGLPVVLEQGLRGEYLPSYQRPWFPRSDWHRYLADRVVALVEELGATLVAFDGVAPYRGLVLARRRLPEASFVWFRRGLWRPGVNRAALRAEPFFDLVVEPGDLAQEADQGATVGRGAAVVPPVSLLDVLEPLPRAKAAKALGLDPKRRTALVTLGSGGLGHDEDAVAAAVAALKDDWQVATTQAALSTHAVEHDVHVLRGVYPLAQYVRAFDLVVSSAGYNAVHEFVSAGVPTVLVPNTRTSTDDQVARARKLDEDGLAVCLESGAAGLPDAVARATALEPAKDLPGQGAQAAAELLLGLSDGPGEVTFLTRARRARYLARSAVVDTALRLLGESLADRLRTWRRSGKPGLTHLLVVDVTLDPAAPRAERPTVLVTERLDRELVAREDPVEHLLEGTSPAYRQKRLAIVSRAYDVRSGL